MKIERPLFKHIRNHSALFSALSDYRIQAMNELGLHGYEFHKTPMFVTDSGARLTIEPERSIVVPSVRVLSNIKSKLVNAIPSLSMVANSEIGYRYPTAALAGLEAPFIKRMRSEYFHRIDEDRSICRPVNLSYGIKSRGKADNRLEYEVWMPDEAPEQSPLPLLIDRYGEDLPDDVRHFVEQPSKVHGWMGVKRAAFEALYHNPSNCGDLVICIAMSVDAYNIGAKPDLSYSPEAESSIALSNAEFEWEIDGYYAPRGWMFDHDTVWEAINHTLEAINGPLEDFYANDIIPSNESKTERILSTIQALGVTQSEIDRLNLQPWEFLLTQSEHRVKAHDPSRKVNLLGRLNRLFYQPEQQLPSLNAIHDLIL
ncbi:hypothetical protein KUL42_03400 [Alteromonas sp. KUL42]|uniref:hypothetical protein n=1 Tax=Alteromonas sp. KUL42 TaxID=2480797 RepID=UPI001035E2E1|nr:hypothetical protein [Alteromonas sp. KUL42]TAP38336.1 hypothetical protein EYR97_01680 [Alteromonas sp. KUL42]GEA05579.1 hypothetical protein KUL42_03400 [Alteromonas sp. KUL42]